MLRVATRNAPTSYYIGRRKQAKGPEHDMVTAFAEHLGVDVEFVVEDSITDVLGAVEAGRADLAAAGLSRTRARAERFRFGPAYQKVRQQVVCGSRKARADDLAELAQADLHVIADSSYEERLSDLKADQPALDWTAVEGVTTEMLLRRVWKGEFDCTVADSNIVDINRRYFPELLVSFNLSEADALSWLLPRKAGTLETAVADWLAGYRESGQLAALRERYYGFIEKFDFLDKKRLRERIANRYPKYDPLFEKAAEATELETALLAAQGYQESHWDPKARSPTGVRGIMMLTRPTARELGVSNRLDPAQSIDGGARYLARMRGRLDESVPEPDRTYLALAAYNVGLGHLRDAQRLARRRSRDPHAWSSISDVLPDLSKKSVYSTLRYGYARGREPVRYVQRIRDYQDVIERHAE